MSRSETLAPTDTLLNFSFYQRLPVVLQTEDSECGLACLAMVAGYFGYHSDLPTLRRNYSISTHGATLRQVMDIASSLGLAGRPLKLDLEHLCELQTPCILHWEMNHFVVLKKVSRNKVTIHDPAVGERAFTLEEVSRFFTGIALELTPTQNFERGEAKTKLRFRHFWNKATGIKRNLFIVLILSLLLQLFALASPYYMQTVVDDVLVRSDKSLLSVLALGFGLLLLVEIGTNVLRQFVILNFSNCLNMQMSANVFHHLIRLPLEYFNKRHMGDVVSRFGSMANIRELFTTGLISACIDGIMAIITLIVMLIYDVRLTAIVLGVVFLYGLLRYLLYRPLRLLNEELLVTVAKEQSHFMESVRAIQTIKLFQKETDRQGQWQNRRADSMNMSIRIERWGIGYDAINKILFGIENIVVIYFAAWAVMDSVFSVGMLFAFVSYKTRFISSMDGLIEKFIEFKMVSLHFDRLADIVFTEQDQTVKTAANAIEQGGGEQLLSGDIQVKNLSFHYSNNDKPVLANLSFRIRSGESVAIVGPSGGGKSTLLKCLMGLFRATEGDVLIDSKPIHQVFHYRDQIAGVMQDDQLLSGSIAENIACFDTQIDLERVTQCAYFAGIHEEIMGMAMQYNTLVGDMGTSLSGGQKQRLLLARALYRKPCILFMDEATSHLDTNNEQIINDNLSKLNITRVVVAHRPETIRKADRVLVLVNGVLTENTNSTNDTEQNCEYDYRSY